MAKKGGAFSFFIKLVVFFGFLFYEYKMYEEYKKVKRGVENKKETLYTKVANSFVRREDNFYLDKNYMKEDRNFKEKKRLEAEEKRLEELRKLEELKAMEEQKKLEAEKLAEEKLEDKLKEDSSKDVAPHSNGSVAEKKESKPFEKIVEKPKVQESVKKEEVVKKVNKTVSKESKQNIPKGAVNIKKTKIESIEKTTKKREDLPKVKIHEVERKVEKPKENIEIKEENINSNIKNEQPKKEKSSGFKEIEMLGN